MRESASGTDRGHMDSSPRNRQELIFSVVGAAILLLATAAIIVFLGLRAGNQSSAGPSTPSDSVEPTATTPASPLPTPGCEPVISSGGVEVSVAPPVSAVVRDTSFPVEPIIPDTEIWSYPSDRSGVAVWVCGTVVNYVIGLEPTAETADLIASLAPGESIRLRLANGTVLAFRFAGRREVEVGDESILAQQRPHLTLLLPGDGQWQVATADYVTEEVPAELTVSGSSVQPGEPALVGEVRVTVDRGYTTRIAGLAPGTAYYLVEFSVENLSATPLPAQLFSMRLRDALGNTYLASPVAGDAGEYGPLREEIDPAVSVQGTAGYLVPDPLPAGPVIWSFSPRPESEEHLQVTIPSDTAEGTASQRPSTDVIITDAFLSAEGDSLIVLGEIRSGAAESLSVQPDDVSLSSSAGVSELVAAAPPLPWSIGPGQTQVIELQYQRPAASTALLELLGFSFEIGGLQ